MSIAVHVRCSEAIRFLRFNWFQNPEVTLNEQLQAVRLNSEYLKNDSELFKVFRQKMHRRLNKHYYELLDLMDTENFVWQVMIMWTLLKTKQKKDLKYEQIKKAITVPKLKKQFGEDGNLTSVQEKKRHKALKLLQRTRFIWERNLVEVLNERLEVAGLNMDILGESLTLFNKLKNQLSRQSQFDRFCEFYTLLEAVNQRDYQWQIYIMWKVLHDMKFRKRTL